MYKSRSNYESTVTKQKSFRQKVFILTVRPRCHPSIMKHSDTTATGPIFTSITCSERYCCCWPSLISRHFHFSVLIPPSVYQRMFRPQSAFIETIECLLWTWLAKYGCLLTVSLIGGVRNKS